VPFTLNQLSTPFPDLAMGLLKGKPIILIGVNFDGKHGKVAGWKSATQEVTG
jgi:hypothetical protein